MDKPIRSLEDIFADPDAATLLAPDKKPVINHDPDVEGFKEIIDWVKQHDGKEPPVKGRKRPFFRGPGHGAVDLGGRFFTAEKIFHGNRPTIRLKSSPRCS